MKVSINKYGLLIITPESELEEWAIKIWCDTQVDDISNIDILIEEYEYE